MSAELESLLARVAAAYAACRTYRDEGVATTTFIRMDEPHRTDRRPFSTRFVRPGGFLFEYRRRRCEDHWEQYAIWMDGARARTWCRIVDDREPTASLRSALAVAAGWTSHVSERVPLLLMPDLGGELWPESVRRPMRLVEVPEAAAQGCIVVERPPPALHGRIEQLWIDRASLLIRRIVVPRFALDLAPTESRGAAPTRGMTAGQPVDRRFEFEETITYEPVFDAEVASSELRFVPPSPSPE